MPIQNLSKTDKIHDFSENLAIQDFQENANLATKF